MPISRIALALSVSVASGMTLAQDPGTDSRYPDLVQTSSDEEAIGVYIVPLRGQVGTDILPELYEPIIEDIKGQGADIVIFHVDSHDRKNIDDEAVDIFKGRDAQPGQADSSYPALKPMGDLRQAFNDELPEDIQQICYVEDAMSVASLLALSWDQMYIDPDAEFGGAYVVWAWMAAPVAGDSQKYGKYLRAIMGDVQGIAQYGGWDGVGRREFVRAMVVPEARASTTWRGRDATWYRDARGDLMVDSVGEMPRKADMGSLAQSTINLSGMEADQLLVADGTAARDRFVKDILAQLGHRRFRIVGNASDAVEKHRASWRSAASRARENFLLYRRMSGGGFMYQLQAALKGLNSYISAIKSNKAVETRMRLERMPTDVTALEMQRDDLKELIRNRRGGGGGGRGGGGGLGGGGGGPGGI
ncbi:MAG: hypothetical protein QF733_09670 [Phycisphaerales bacterium]|jgi:uncharacterized membrane protein YgcG|nr:hypothetical protein [Phycisphaerales bacterium]